MFNFDCGYINRPYCSLRPFDNFSPCPKFSCPPPFNRCTYPYNPPFQPPFCDGFQSPYCCTHYGCQQPFPPFQRPCPPPLPPHRPPCGFPPMLNNLMWFYGGFRCGSQKGRDHCGLQPNLLRDFIKRQK